MLSGRESRHQVSISAPWHLGGSLLGGLVFGSHLLGHEHLMGGTRMLPNNDVSEQWSAPSSPKSQTFTVGTVELKTGCLGNECSLSAPFSRLNYSNPVSSFPQAVSARISLICAHGGLMVLSPPSGARRPELSPHLHRAQSAPRPRGSGKAAVEGAWAGMPSGHSSQTTHAHLMAQTGHEATRCLWALKPTGPSSSAAESSD